MTALVQQRFLGSSIRSFNTSLGWGGQESSLSISLADDVINGDAFLPPSVGAPVLFNFMGWTSAGLLQRWTQTGDVGGYPVYECSLVDPRILLDGVQVILSDYTGVVTLPNLINVYGYLENQGFGTAKLNEAGIPWNLVRTSLDVLLQGTIQFRGYKYALDISSLPLIPNYRLGGPVMSVMDIINDVCEATSCDYFIKLENDLITIRVYLVSRASQPLLGKITQYVAQTPDAKTREIGFEMVNEDNSKFIFGDKRQELFYVSASTRWILEDNRLTTDDEETNTIWPFWGHDFDGNLIIGRGFGDRHTFTIDSRAILLENVGNSYPTNLGEIRAALSDQDVWESYLWTNCFNEFYIEEDGNATARYYKINNRGQFVPGTVSYSHNNYPNPLFGRAFRLKLVGGISNDIISKFLNATNAEDFLNTHTDALLNVLKQGQNIHEEKDPIEKLYSFLNEYASEYYGRKFMVLMPQVQWYRDPETDRVFLSHEPLGQGFVEEDVWLNGISRNLLPIDINKITTEDGKIEAFVRFDNAESLDLTEIPPEDIMYGTFYKVSNSRFGGAFKSLFVKCSVEPSYAYLDFNTGLSPRAIVTINRPMYTKVDDQFNTSLIVDWLNNVWSDKQVQYPPSTPPGPNDFTNDNKDKILKKLTKSIGALFSNLTTEPMFVPPDLAAVGILYNKEVYGPWFAAGADGRVSVEADSSLAPWNFGGTYEALNKAATARFNDVSLQQVAEYGRVEVPGPPSLDLGSQLLNSGPYVTDIQMSVGTDGVTTTYSFKTWSPRFGKLARHWADKIARNDKANQSIRRQLREVYKNQALKRGKRAIT